MSTENLSGIELLRFAVNALSYNRESVNERFSATELLNIAECYRACEWDFFPDQWTEDQLLAAAHGRIIPQWDMHANPIESKKELGK